MNLFANLLFTSVFSFQGGSPFLTYVFSHFSRPFLKFFVQIFFWGKLVWVSFTHLPQIHRNFVIICSTLTCFDEQHDDESKYLHVNPWKILQFTINNGAQCCNHGNQVANLIFYKNKNMVNCTNLIKQWL